MTILISSSVGKSCGVLRQLYITQHILSIHIKLLIAKSYLMPVLFYGVEFGAAIIIIRNKIFFVSYVIGFSSVFKFISLLMWYY